MKHIITAFTLMSLTHPVYADDIKPVPLNGFQEAAIFGIDRAICSIPVPQSAIDRKIIQGMLEANLPTYQEALNQTAYLMQDYLVYLDQSKSAYQYCLKRRGF